MMMMISRAVLASRMPLVSSLVALVAAMRVRGLDRGACGPLADRRAAAAARRELAGHLLLAVLVWRNGWLSSMITKAAACWSWCLSITNSFITVHLARASSFDVLVLVGEVRMQAVLHTDGILLLKNMRRVWSSELASLFYMWRTASSRSFSRCAGRRRRFRAAGMSGAGRRACCSCAAGRVARARLLHHSLPALEPQHGPNHSPS